MVSHLEVYRTKFRVHFPVIIFVLHLPSIPCNLVVTLIILGEDCVKKLHSNIIPSFGTSFHLGKKNGEAISVTGRGGS
jgi:hypothetical protein